MSRYRIGDCDIKSMTGLILALDEMGFKDVEVFETPQPLFGYQDDERVETAQVIIRRKHIGSMSNDVGFRMEPNGTWKAIISEFDEKRHFKDGFLQKLSALACLHDFMETAKKRGEKAVRRTTETGEEEVRVYV